MEAAHDMKPQLGQLMVEYGLITPDQLAHALAEQQRVGRPLGKLLVDLGFVSEGAVANALATQHGGLLKTEFGISAGFAPVAVAPPPAPDPPAPAAPGPDPRVAELEAELDRLQGERTALHEHVLEVRTFAERAAAAEQAAVSRAHELEEALRTTQPKLAALAEEAESLRAQLAAAEQQPGENTREDELLASLAALEGDLAAARSRVAELEEEAARPRAEDEELQAARSRIAELEQHAGDLSGRVEALQAQLEPLREEVESLRAQLSDAESQEPDTSREDSLLSSLASLEGELTAARARALELEDAERRRAQEVESLTADLDELRAQLAEATPRDGVASEAHAVLEGLLSTAATLQSAAGAAEAVLRETAEAREAPRIAELAAEVERLRAELEAERARPVEQAPEPDPQPEAEPEPEHAHLLFVPSPSGYALVEREGPAPASGALLDVDGIDFRVTRVGRAPVPGRGLRCAYLLRV